jgi:hypothetical protein
MFKEKRFHKSVWLIMLITSVMLLAWCLLVLAFSRDTILEDLIKLAGSSLVKEDLDAAALGFMNMAMLKPLWEEVWFGIFGIYCALALRGHRQDAWLLSFFWGIVMISNAAIQGGYEIFILGWSYACMQTYFFLLIGIIPVVALLLTRKQYLQAAKLVNSVHEE